ncbi:MAG: hypothetical protein AB7S81_07505 [Bdellovibrionales bacterium]
MRDSEHIPSVSAINKTWSLHMKIEENVLAAIDAASQNDIERSLLHACLALDGTAQKKNGKSHSSRSIYTKFIRDYYWILEPMIGAGINLDDTKWENVDLRDEKNEPLKNKDMANFIYHIFRCKLAHGNEIPQQYKLLKRGSSQHLYYHIANNVLHLPETIIWGLLAISVFSETNKDVITNTNHFLSLGNNQFSISDWWGLEKSFLPIAEKHNNIRVILQDLSFVKAN